jgi:hypothetical protein
MTKYLNLKNILLVVAILCIVAQFIRIDTQNPPIEADKDFIVATKAPEEVAMILKAACYDCHSNTTLYPWYSQVAPVSWWVKDHVNEARHELNFSEWFSFTEKRKAKKLEEAIEEVEEGEMPLSSYTWIHSSAKLNAIQRKKLADFFRTLQVGKSEKEE